MIEQDTEETKVVFRKWRDKRGDILALFPNISADHVGHCLSYEHVGQHGAADYLHCIANTNPATPEDYAELKRELEGRGYRLKIRRRR